MLKMTAQTGFSLVELVLVILVAGMIILVIANITPALNLINTSSRENTARQITAKKIEDIRAQGYDNLANGTSQISDSRLTYLPQAATDITISDCPDTICTHGELIKQVRVKIDWIENKSPKSFEASTLVAKGGIR